MGISCRRRDYANYPNVEGGTLQVELLGLEADWEVLLSENYFLFFISYSLSPTLHPSLRCSALLRFNPLHSVLFCIIFVLFILFYFIGGLPEYQRRERPGSTPPRTSPR